MNAIKKIVMSLAVACATAVLPAMADGVSISSADGAITVTVAADTVAASTPVYLAWDTADKGGTLSAWAHSVQVGTVDAAGDTFEVQGATHSIPNGAAIRAFVVAYSDIEFLEYIQSSGTQYIDTGIVGAWDDVYEIKFAVVSQSADSAYLAAGVDDSKDSAHGRYHLAVRNTAGQLRQCIGGLGSAGQDPLVSPAYATTVGTFYTVVSDFTKGGRKLEIYNADKSSLLGSDTKTTVVQEELYNPNNCTIYIFACNINAEAKQMTRANWKVSSFKLTRGGAVVKNLVAARKGTAVGMVDLANGNEFYPNKGSNSFTAGGVTGKALGEVVSASAASSYEGGDTPEPKKQGLTVAVLGASYCGFEGFVPTGFNPRYPEYTVNRVEKMWWHLFMENYGARLLHTDSCNGWRGTYISMKNDADNLPSLIRSSRLDALGDGKGGDGDPDIILIHGGTNDAWNKVDRGTGLDCYDSATWTAANLVKFRPAVAYMLNYLKTRYVNAEIIVVINTIDDGTNGIDANYANDMAEISAHYGVLAVQTHDIEKVDRHPTAAGMRTIAQQVIAARNAAHEDKDGLIASVSGEVLSVTVAANAFDESRDLYLVWDKTDRGTALDGWANVEKIAANIGSAGGSVEVNLTEKGIYTTKVFRVLASKSVSCDYLLATLRSSGSQYIDLGYTMDITADSFEAELSFPSLVAGTNVKGVFGARDGYYSGDIALQVYKQVSSFYNDRCNCNNTASSTDRATVTPAVGVTYTCFNTFASRETYTAGARTSSSTTNVGPAPGGKASGSAYVFALNEKSEASDRQPTTLTSLSVWTNSTVLAWDLVPCLANGKGALYNRVTGEILTNDGTDDFICGAIRQDAAAVTSAQPGQGEDPEPPVLRTAYLTFPKIGSTAQNAKGNGVVMGSKFANTDRLSVSFLIKNPKPEMLAASGAYNGVIVSTGALGNDTGMMCMIKDTNGEKQFLAQVRSSSAMLVQGTSEVVSVDDGAWHRVVVTYDKSAQAMKIYVDGVSLAVTYYDNPQWGTCAHAHPLTIGRHSYNNFDRNYAGSVADVAYFNTVLTQEEVSAQLSGLTGNEAGLVGWWPMDEGEGTTVHDAKGSNNGTIKTNTDALTDQYWTNDGPKPIAAQVTGATGPANGTAYSCTLTVTRPATGWTAKWFDDTTSTYSLDLAPSYIDEGVYTNVVKVTAGDYLDFYGTGIVTVTHYEPPPPTPTGDVTVTLTTNQREITVAIAENAESDPVDITLVWDTADRGAEIENWAHAEVIGQVKGPSGSVVVDAATYGIESGMTIRAFFGQKEFALYETLTKAAESTSVVTTDYIPGKTRKTSGIDLLATWTGTFRYGDGVSALFFGITDSTDSSNPRRFGASCGSEDKSDNYYTIWTWPQTYNSGRWKFLNTTASNMTTAKLMKLRMDERGTWAGVTLSNAWPADTDYDYTAPMSVFGITTVTAGGEVANTAFGTYDLTLHALTVYEKPDSAHVVAAHYVPAKSGDAYGLYNTVNGAFLPATSNDGITPGTATNSVTGVAFSSSASTQVEFETTDFTAAVTDTAATAFDGTLAQVGLTVTYPASAEVYTQLWDWDDGAGYAHDAPACYYTVGTYTNRVKLTAIGFNDFCGTGVVTIAEGAAPTGAYVDYPHAGGLVKPVNGVCGVPDAGRLQTWDCFPVLKDAGIPYARLHDIGGWFIGGGLFIDIPSIFRTFTNDVEATSSYRFDFTDDLIAHLYRDNGVQPIFRLGVMREEFVAKGLPPLNARKPTDALKWAKICEKIIRHYTEGWNKGYTFDIPYWEIWSSPDDHLNSSSNMLWNASFAEYMEFYGTVATYLKGQFPNLKFGGYTMSDVAALSRGDTSELATYRRTCAESFLAAARDNSWPLDFFSYRLTGDIAGFSADIVAVDTLLDGYGFTRDKTQRFCSEWLPAPTDEKIGSAQQIAEIAAGLTALQQGACDLACLYSALSARGKYAPLFKLVDVKTPRATINCFKAYHELRKLGTAVQVRNLPAGVFATAASDGGQTMKLLIANVSGSAWTPTFNFAPWTVSSAINISNWTTANLPAALPNNSVWLVTLGFNK